MATYQQRGNSIRVLIRPAGIKAITGTFDTEEQAREFVARVEARLRAGLDPVGAPASTRTPVAELLRDYLIEFCEEQHKSFRTTRNLVNGLIGRFEEFQKPVGEFSKDDWERIMRARRRGDRTHGRHVKPVCDGTIRRECGIMSGFFNWLADTKGVPVVNVIKKCEWPMRPEPRMQRALEPQIDRIIAELGYERGTVPETSKHWVAWASLFAIETALRMGNILSMRWSDYRGKTMHCEMTKNGFAHNAPLNSRARALLDLLPRTPGDSNDVIVPLSDTNYAKLWREARDACGLSMIRRHDLRREATTRAAKTFTNIIDLAGFTGHRKLDNLRIYYQPTADELADKLG